MENLEKWSNLGKKLRSLINPSTFPVAVGIFREEDRIPERTRRPLRDLKVRMAPCQGAAMARRYGWTVAFTGEDVGCGIAAHTYGWERVTDERGPVIFATRMNYAADEDAAKHLLKEFLCLDMGDNPVVVYSPLERTKVAPDVVLLYVNPAQLMRLIHGVTYKTGMPIESRFSGRAASCTEGVIGAFLHNSPKVVVPGNGDRVWAACQDHEMVMAIPAGLLEDVVEGLERTHERGIRYPIPSYLRYQPEVAYTIPLADIFRPEAAAKLGKK
jgi:uncharacterized protein (DUF169 family)